MLVFLFSSTLVVNTKKKLHLPAISLRRSSLEMSAMMLKREDYSGSTETEELNELTELNRNLDMPTANENVVRDWICRFASFCKGLNSNQHFQPTTCFYPIDIYSFLKNDTTKIIK